MPDEEDLWLRVARTAMPLHPHPPRPAETAAAPTVQKPQSRRLDPFHVGEKVVIKARHDIAPTVSHWLSSAPVRMDAKTHKSMTRGKLVPEGRIDLHGMTLSEAHPELNHFVLEAHAAGKRLVLVITGKGRSGGDHGPIPQRPGILKRQVPHWLAMPPLGALVLQVTEAHLRHGGSGAYYVYLRRN